MYGSRMVPQAACTARGGPLVMQVAWLVGLLYGLTGRLTGLAEPLVFKLSH